MKAMLRPRAEAPGQAGLRPRAQAEGGAGARPQIHMGSVIKWLQYASLHMVSVLNTGRVVNFPFGEQ